MSDALEYYAALDLMTKTIGELQKLRPLAVDSGHKPKVTIWNFEDAPEEYKLLWGQEYDHPDWVALLEGGYGAIDRLSYDFLRHCETKRYEVAGGTVYIRFHD